MPAPSLSAELRRRIKVAGPMPVWQFMGLCLTHPEHGYYTTRDPLGRSGDFTTSPEISQVFGELVGLWAAAVWQMMGSPENVRLVELGPGRGTLMKDALRAIQVLPAFRSAIVVSLVEISPVLQQRQRETLADVDVPMLWHDGLDQVPPGPAIVLANEFYDALPVHQAVKHINGWYERVIGIDDAGNFAFGMSDDRLPHFDQLLPQKVREAPIGSIFEWRNDSVTHTLARRFVREGGAALVIDYGHTVGAAGETLQAVSKHAFADPLAAPGEADLTAHVDFQAIVTAAECMGAKAHGPVTQADFLRSLGLDARAAVLKAGALERSAEIDAAVARLTAEEATGMGRLFKALAFADARLGPLPGFES